MRHNDRRYCPSTSHLLRIAAVLAVIVLLSGVGGAVNTITFNASQTIDFDITTADLGTYNQTGLNLHNNDLYNFFAADQCTGSEVVSEIYSNGSYACTDISTYDTDTDDQNLSEVLTQGNVANQTIEFNGGIEIGDSSTTVGGNPQAVAVGSSANASGSYASAFGSRASASGDSALAVGPYASASGYASAVGSSAEASEDSALAVGSYTDASAEYASAVGTYADATRDYASAFGYYTYASGYYASAVGSYASAAANGAVAIGHKANAPNRYEATFGNLGAEKLDVNVTGNLTVHGSGGLDVLNGSVNMNGNNLALNGGYLSNDGGNEGLQIDNSGNVEIPNGKLDVDYAGEAAVFGASSPGQRYVRFRDSGQYGSTVGYSNSIGNGATIVQSGAGKDLALSVDNGTFGSGTNALLADPNANVEIPNGNLDVSGQFSTGSTNCGTNEYIGGDGGCKTDSTGTDDQTLSEVLSQGNSAGSSNIDLNSNNIRGIGNLYSSAGLDIYSGAGGRVLLRSRGSGGVLGWYDDYNNRWVQKYNNGGDLLLDPVGNVKLRIADLDMGGNSITGTDSLEFDGGIEAGTGAVTTGRSDQTAVGNGANATGNFASAFGNDASASQIYASAFGYGADATAGSALAVGYDTSASASSASAFGSYADASADSALAVGRDTSASADSALAVGSSAYASADSASAVGYGAYASASSASAFGSYADATAEGAVAIGYAANAPNQYEATFGNLGNQYRGGPLDVNITGNLTVHENLEVYGGTKNFVQQVNESHEVVYTSSESSEAVVEWSNVTTVEDDGTRIAFPPHLDLVMSDVEDFHVYATPVESLADVGVFNKTDTGFTLKASSPTQVDFHLRGVRKGYEDKPVVRRRK